MMIRKMLIMMIMMIGSACSCVSLRVNDYEDDDNEADDREDEDNKADENDEREDDDN
jgi:hypothetical protein